MSSNLLIDEPPLLIQPTLALLVGLNEAIFLQQVHYWLNPRFNKNKIDGRLWVHNTYEQWQKQFPFWGEKTIRRTIGSLEGLRVLESYVKTLKFRKTKFYTINYKVLSSLKSPEKKETPPSGHNDQTDLSVWADSCGHNDQIQTVKVTGLYKDTKTTTEITSLLPNRCKKEEEDLYKKMIFLWNESVQKKLNKKPLFVTEKRLKKLAFVLERYFESDLEQWEAYCQKISKNDFLMGNSASGFQARLEWALQSENIFKVLEDAFYSKPTKDEKTPCLSVPTERFQREKRQENPYQKEWSAICQELLKKLGEKTFRAWLSPLIPRRFSETTAELSAPSQLMKSYVETHLLGDLQKAIQTLYPSIETVCITDNTYAPNMEITQ